MAASHNGHPEVARLFCEAGADKDKAMQDVGGPCQPPPRCSKSSLALQDLFY